MTSPEAGLPEGTHTIVMGAGDINGVLRGKRIPREQWPRVCESGIGIASSMFACDMTSDIWDTPYSNMDNGFPDMKMFPGGPVRSIPWEEGCGFCLGHARTMAGEPVPIDPRIPLVEQTARAEAMGYQVSVGAELEFYLLDPETRRPVDVGNQFYGLGRAAELEHVIGPIRRHLVALGIPIEQSNAEYAAGQIEVNIRYGPILESADQVVAFRYFVKEIAREHGYLATFMSKPLAGESGSGFHTHYSLWKDGRNLFASADGRLSRIGRQFLAGLQKRMAETALAGATTPNAFRRRERNSFCPTSNCWGYDNRTVGLRVLEGEADEVRIEKRDGSADCNPYYLLASELAAGLDGIEAAMDPDHFCAGNGYEFEGAETLPADLGTAIVRARESEFLKQVLGADRLEILAGQAERELAFFNDQVTQVELDRYLLNF